MSEISERLQKYGLTEGQMRQGKWLHQVEDMMADLTAEEAKEMGSRVLKENTEEAKTAAHDLEKQIERAEAVKRELMKAYKPSDTTVLDARYIFMEVIKGVKETYGEENMTEAVMIAAIQAGSYGLWRTIMGESKGQWK